MLTCVRNFDLFVIKRLLLAISVLMAFSSIHARELKIGTGNFPPYFSEKGTDGLFNDLIREAFDLMPQHKLTFVPEMSNYRLVQSLNDGTVDGAANILAKSKIVGCLSDPVFRYADVAVTRKDHQLKIDSVGDLAEKRIATYQGAKTFLGSEFARVVSTDARLYRELPQQLDQAMSVSTGLSDVSVGDMYIFLYSIKHNSNGKFKADQFDIHNVFPVTYSFMGFHEQILCDEFNVALRKLKKSGRYEAIYSRYLKHLQ
jgi:ABC-type amino acid transport substrate-binding protein